MVVVTLKPNQKCPEKPWETYAEASGKELADDASMAGPPPGLEQKDGDQDGDAGDAPQHIAAKVPHDKEEDVSRLSREVQALSEKLAKKDKENDELAEKMLTIQSQMQYCGYWCDNNGQYGVASSSSWQGQSSMDNGGGGWGGGGWGQDSTGGGRAGRSRDRGSRERDGNRDRGSRETRERDGNRESPPRHHRGGSGDEPGMMYIADAIEATKAEKKYRLCSLVYASPATGPDDAFIISSTGRCRHCQVTNWAAKSPDGPPKHCAPFPFGQIEEEDYQNYLANTAKNVKDWSSPETRAHAFSTSLWMRNFTSSADNSTLCANLSKKDLLWKPALLGDPEHKGGEQGWLCLWYKDSRSITLFCRHCKRSTGFTRCSKDRDKVTKQCHGHEDGDDSEWPVLAGSNLDHQRWLRALLTNVTGVQWAARRER